MITQNEINTVELSTTKKDFIQIWSELLDVSKKLSNRFSPDQSNEADPVVVLLKVLTAIADKLEYNVDANILEAFMPSAAQMESMRKLTEMLGYNMKYYQSATTQVKITYKTNNNDELPSLLTIDKYTNIKDIDDSINFVTLNAAYISNDTPSTTVDCIEGELVECETDDDNIVSTLQLDDNNRYYLPETQIAENGIFITNVDNGIELEETWTKVDNLNTQPLNSKVFKFGYDSSQGLPYIQFPDDISGIIEDGIKIKYIRTNGTSGNISANVLTKLETPASWSTVENDTPDYYNVDNYTVTNPSACFNGTNIESIDEAYNNFKRTIGTFDTLVTCRDYMNKIYQMTEDEVSSTPLVSNVLVTDIRTDPNKAYTLCTFTEHGTEYKTLPRFKDGEQLIQPFDLIIYPFQAPAGLNTKDEYINSFKYDNSTLLEIQDNLENTKNIAHTIKEPDIEDLACIKNYLKLNAKINTIRKVGQIEEAEIKNNIFKAIYTNFNMRKLDFGEEIPYDTILKVISNADSRIKSVILDEPSLTTAFCTVNNVEHILTNATQTDNQEDEASNEYYNKCVLNNVLAGRIPMFNYNTDFSTSYSEKEYSPGGFEMIYPIDSSDENKIYQLKPELTISAKASAVTLQENEIVQFRRPNLRTDVTYPAYVNYYLKLNKENWTDANSVAIPATFETLESFLTSGLPLTDPSLLLYWKYYLNYPNYKIEGNSLVAEQSTSEPVLAGALQQVTITNKEDLLNTTKYKVFVTKNGNTYEPQDRQVLYNSFSSSVTLYYPVINSNTIIAWNNLIKNLKTTYLYGNDGNIDTAKGAVDLSNSLNSTWKRTGLYVQATAAKTTNIIGYCVDNMQIKYKVVETALSLTVNDDPFQKYYVQKLWTATSPNETNSEIINSEDQILSPISWHTQNGLGRSIDYIGIPANSEYQLQAGEKLLINYTQSSTDDTDQSTIYNEVYEAGTIIRPNFALVDSANYNQTHSWNKTNGFNFADKGETISGMFTLGTNEQIEIRSLINTELDRLNSNIYFERISEQPDTNGQIHFTFDDPDYTLDGVVYKTYTLKDGEYFYYTDGNKTELSYYGSGTVIMIKASKSDGSYTSPIDIYKSSTDTQVTTNDIITNGLAAAIPWRTYNLSANPIKIVEYQYTTLTKGDTLLSVTTPGSDTNTGSADTDSIQLDIDGSWKKIGTASYTIASSDGASSSKINLPTLKIDNVNWEVSSRLHVNLSPNYAQTLVSNANSTQKIILRKWNSVSEEYEPSTELKPKEVDGTFIPLSLKSNTLVQGSSTIIDVSTPKYNTSGTKLVGRDSTFKIKVFENSIPQVTNTSDTTTNLNLNNFGNNNNYTRISFSNNNTTKAYTALNCLLPKDHFGLIMFYCVFGSETDGNAAKGPYLKCNNSVTPTIYNKDAWWTTVSDGNYYLRQGINIVKITKSCTIEIYDSNNNGDILIFSNLDLVPTDATKAINPKLDYKKRSTANALAELLNDIKNIDKDFNFYYNNIPANDIIIDLNKSNTDEILSSPLSWYDKNNINNSFVISEIDANAMEDGIKIAESSRS